MFELLVSRLFCLLVIDGWMVASLFFLFECNAKSEELMDGRGLLTD
jgi:hypothetical protein